MVGTSDLDHFLNESVSGANVGKWRQLIDEEEATSVRSIVAPWNERLGYDSHRP
jgi:hypothetical protein